MVKIGRSHHWVWPDRYYIWTYFPEKYRKTVNKVSNRTLYAKHYTCIPFFTRRHAKHVACFYHGVKALHHIHIISGKRLIAQGITTFNKANGQKKYQSECFIRQRNGNWYPAHMRQWAYPPEYHYDSHRRRYYIVALNKAFGNGGKKGRKSFNQKYAQMNYGHSYRRISRWFFRRNIYIMRRICWNELDLEKLSKDMANNSMFTIKGNQTSGFPFTINKCTKQGKRKLVSINPIIINSKVEFDTLLEEVKQFNTDPGNIRKGIYILLTLNKQNNGKENNKEG